MTARIDIVHVPYRGGRLPDVPTVAEPGFADFEVDAWYGVLAPRGTPGAIVNRLSAEIAKCVATPGVRESFLSLGIEPVGSTPGEFTAHLETEIARWTPIVHEVGLKID